MGTAITSSLLGALHLLTALEGYTAGVRFFFSYKFKKVLDEWVYKRTGSQAPEHLCSGALTPGDLPSAKNNARRLYR